MSQIELKEEEIKELEEQYFSTKDYLEDLVRTKKSQKYKEGTEMQRRHLDMQLNFLKGSQNILIECLIDHDTDNIGLLKTAKWDKLLTRETRRKVRECLKHKPISLLL